MRSSGIKRVASLIRGLSRSLASRAGCWVDTNPRVILCPREPGPGVNAARTRVIVFQRIKVKAPRVLEQGLGDALIAALGIALPGIISTADVQAGKIGWCRKIKTAQRIKNSFRVPWSTEFSPINSGADYQISHN